MFWIAGWNQGLVWRFVDSSEGRISNAIYDKHGIEKVPSYWQWCRVSVLYVSRALAFLEHGD